MDKLETQHWIMLFLFVAAWIWILRSELPPLFDDSPGDHETRAPYPRGGIGPGSERRLDVELRLECQDRLVQDGTSEVMAWEICNSR